MQIRFFLIISSKSMENVCEFGIFEYVYIYTHTHRFNIIECENKLYRLKLTTSRLPLAVANKLILTFIGSKYKRQHAI